MACAANNAAISRACARLAAIAWLVCLLKALTDLLAEETVTLDDARTRSARVTRCMLYYTSALKAGDATFRWAPTCCVIILASIDRTSADGALAVRLEAARKTRAAIIAVAQTRSAADALYFSWLVSLRTAMTAGSINVAYD